MERLGIAATQGECSYILRIERLPANRYLRLLGVIRAMPCGNSRLDPNRQHSRGIVAIPFLPLCKVYFEAVKPTEVPPGPGQRNSYVLVDCPHSPLHPDPWRTPRAT